MSRVPLTVACWDYDRTRALREGTVQVEGCDVNYLSTAPEETFFRAFTGTEFDVTELSFSSYMVARSRGTCPYLAVPVFPSRAFRHSAIYIRTDRGIHRPEDLKGRIVGVPEYQITASLWVRGILQDEYGVRPSDLDWRTGGIEQPGRHEKLTIQPPGVHIVPTTERSLSDMLADGEIDALVTARAPSCFRLGKPHVGRLFPNFRDEEKAYFSKTGIFPIMHVLGIRESLIQEHPWLPSSVYKAFEQSKQACLRELEEVTALKVTLPWVVQEAEETRRLMGNDYWPYGVAENRKVLDTLVRYSWDQGLSKRPLAVEELFAQQTLEITKI
jgi:4,5-dihydroxyphthalate decarboxylase